MRDDKLSNQSIEFAIEIINLVKELKSKKESIISNQIGRSATSIGANIREAKYAHSRNDFISKLQIALKECHETEYWLELMQRTEILSDISAVIHNCGVIRKMLISSINTAKNNS